MECWVVQDVEKLSESHQPICFILEFASGSRKDSTYWGEHLEVDGLELLTLAGWGQSIEQGLPRAGAICEERKVGGGGKSRAKLEEFIHSSSIRASNTWHEALVASRQCDNYASDFWRRVSCWQLIWLCPRRRAGDRQRVMQGRGCGFQMSDPLARSILDVLLKK
jgi:hypothetical protein